MLAALVRRHLRVAAAAVISVLLAVTLAYLSHRLAGGDTVDLGSFLGTTGIDDRRIAFPGLRLVVATAAIVSVSPSLTRPFRFVGRAILTAGAVATVGLTVSTVVGALGSLAAGVAGAAAVHLLLGSPGGRPSRERVLAALDDLGVPVRSLDAARFEPAGVVLMHGEHADGRPLAIKVYGRDAWDSQLVTKVWRSSWYRESGVGVLLSRLHQVEHEAVITGLAGRSGAHAPAIITAGTSTGGDALLVATHTGTPLAALAGDSEDSEGSTDPGIDDQALDELWHSTVAVHDDGIVHGGIDLRSVVVDDDGRLGLTNWGAGDVAATDDLIATERAQLLVLTTLVVDLDRAVDLAHDALGTDGLAAVVPYLQGPALTRSLNRDVRNHELDLAELRTQAAERAGIEEADLVELRRVTPASIGSMALLAIAAWLLISSLADIGFDTIVDELSVANWGWVLAALIVAQGARIFSAIGTTGATTHPLRLGPTVLLEFAVTFVNLAVPSSAGRIATKMRYFQRAGMALPSAMTMGALDGLAGFIVQLLILVAALVFGAGGVELDVDIDPEAVQRLGLIVLIAVVVLTVVSVVVVLVSQKLRARLAEVVAHARQALAVVRAPDRLVRLFGGNLGAELTFAIALGLAVKAYGESAPLFGLIVVNVMVALFAGLMPVPGGIGVTEAALTTGLIAIGVSEPAAVAAALTSRLCTFYLPPIWGYIALRWLRRNQYL